MRSAIIKNFAMPLVFLGALLFAVFLGRYVPCGTKSLFYAFSLAIKEFLIFALPFVIFSLVFVSITKLGAKALKYVFIILPLICCSNFMNTVMSYLTSSFSNNYGLNLEQLLNNNQNILAPTFSISLPKLIANDMALLIGLGLGLIVGLFYNNFAHKISLHFNKFTSIFFKIITPIMPLFIIGTAFKLEHEGVLGLMWKQYFPVLITFIISAYGFVLFQLFCLAKFSVSKFFEYLRNLFEPAITAFGSMSSAAALPLSIRAAEKNSENPSNAAVIAPATVNIHLIGDCFFIPMIALAVMTSFGMSYPSFNEYLIFAFHFVIAKFAVAAVPGGGVLVMIPVMQSYLGFSADMLAIVTAMYVLFDPIITMCNVLGNGSMAILFDKLTLKFFKK